MQTCQKLRSEPELVCCSAGSVIPDVRGRIYKSHHHTSVCTNTHEHTRIKSAESAVKCSSHGSDRKHARGWLINCCYTNHSDPSGSSKTWRFTFEFRSISWSLHNFFFFATLQDFIRVVKVITLCFCFFFSKWSTSMETAFDGAPSNERPLSLKGLSPVNSLPGVGKPRETKEERECILLSYVIPLHNIHILRVLIPPRAKGGVKCIWSRLEQSCPVPHMSSSLFDLLTRTVYYLCLM